MGSFNLFCAATGIPLTYDDPVIAFRVKPIIDKHGRGMPGDCLTASHFITSWPIVGKYDDYGYINGDDGKVYGDRRNRDWMKDEEKHDDPDDGEYMIFHRFAYDAMMRAFCRERDRHAAWMKEYYAENAKPDWKVSEEKEIEDLIVEQEQRVADSDN